MKLFTIGFTKTKASQFFGRLEHAGVKQVLDTRLNRVSQLSGFAKQDDLRFFLSAISNVDYRVEQELAPTADILDAYRKKDIDWPEYARRYVSLLSSRKVEERLSSLDLDHVCLLCSEATPDHCHRRLAAEYLADSISGLTIKHL
jgi:uncharacterized protein (DUF488 family)